MAEFLQPVGKSQPVHVPVYNNTFGLYILATLCIISKFSDNTSVLSDIFHFIKYNIQHDY